MAALWRWSVLWVRDRWQPLWFVGGERGGRKRNGSHKRGVSLFSFILGKTINDDVVWGFFKKIQNDIVLDLLYSDLGKLETLAVLRLSISWLWDSHCCATIPYLDDVLIAWTWETGVLYSRSQTGKEEKDNYASLER